jgi:hypothetical protein
MRIFLDMPTREVDEKNNQWEVLLRETCEAVLRPEHDAHGYCEAVLDEMHTGEAYESVDGTPYYYEISMWHTVSGCPVVVSM